MSTATDAQLTTQYWQAQAELNKRRSKLPWQEIYQFVYNAVKHFDESHGYEHATRVKSNAMAIALSDEFVNLDIDFNLLELMAYFHDVCDHKYLGKPGAITKDQRNQYLESILHNERDYNLVVWVIDHVSFSQNQNFNASEGLAGGDYHRYHNHLNIISDADKLEALGPIGLQRCMQVTTMRGGRIPQDVVQHCHDKLLRLLPGYFIVTRKGREMAAPGHNFICGYASQNEEHEQESVVQCTVEDTPES